MPPPSSESAAPEVPEPSSAAAAVRDDFETRRDIRLLRVMNRVYGRAFQRLHRHNLCPIPPTGPALIAANHTAGLDPSMIQAACPRPIVWVMTREFYDLPHLRWFFRWTQMIPIDVAGRDSGAWREAIRNLKLGRVVGVFPEGRIEREDELLPFQTGVSLLALRGGADLYPVYLDGRQRCKPMARTYLLPQRPSIAWGEPLTIPRARGERPSLESITAELHARVEELRERYPAPSRRGAGATASPEGEAAR